MQYSRFCGVKFPIPSLLVILGLSQRISLGVGFSGEPAELLQSLGPAWYPATGHLLRAGALA